ncbi:hypothetical protein KAW38_04910 [Candidatus Micrarchaeota archaeon]|nr:hypothetical protein [Candidatus Micrarchaeota archaeon]
METIYGVRVKDKDKYKDLGAGIEINGEYILPPLEAIYLKRKGLLDSDIDEKELFEMASKKRKYYKEEYRIFEFFRKKHYIVREGLLPSDFLRIYKKGIRFGEDRTLYLLKVVKDLNLEEMRKDMEKAINLRKELVYAIIENEKPTFIKVYYSSF